MPHMVAQRQATLTVSGGNPHYRAVQPTSLASVLSSKRILTPHLRISAVFLLAACGDDGATPPSQPPPVVSVEGTPDNAKVSVTGMVQLTATFRDAAGNILEDRTVRWFTDNIAVATVSETGLVTGVAEGLATISAVAEGEVGRATVTSVETRFSLVSAGGAHTCGVDTTGVAYCWGDNSSGQLGNGRTLDSHTPVRVSGGLTFAFVDAGGKHTCGSTAIDRALFCWGRRERTARHRPHPGKPCAREGRGLGGATVFGQLHCRSP